MVAVTVTNFEGEQFTVEANTVRDLKRLVTDKIRLGEDDWWLTQGGRLLDKDGNANLEDVLVKGDGEDSYPMHLSEKLQQSEDDEHRERRLRLRVDKTRFIVTGTKTKFRVLKVDQERKRFSITLTKRFYKEEKFGIVTNDDGRMVQATFYKIPEEGEIRLETEGDDVLVRLITTNNHQGRVLDPAPLEGTEEVWDRKEIITPRERIELVMQAMGIAVGVGRVAASIATQVPA